jgi:hypothetical protein
MPRWYLINEGNVNIGYGTLDERPNPKQAQRFALLNWFQDFRPGWQLDLHDRRTGTQHTLYGLSLSEARQLAKGWCRAKDDSTYGPNQ